VKEYGDTLVKQQQSLRNKISEHYKSAAHSKAVKILEVSKKKTIEKLTVAQLKAQESTTAKVFRTVYKQAKLNRPFADMEHEVQLQKMNGIDLGRILHSDH